VNGEDASPLYKLLKTSKGGDEIEWNFAKFLVDRDGKVVERYAPTTPPSDFEVRF
jgi:glutathione peroxidase